MRLTFVGDIACDRPLLKAAKRGEEYDFSQVFDIKEIFLDSDFVVGNLETCFGGGRYGKKTMHYNTPDAFAKAIKDADIDFVSTANNHCLDEDVNGLVRTLKILDEENIDHTGTFAGDGKRYAVRAIQGIKVAFFSLTYSVNRNIESFNCPDLYKYINIIGYKPINFSKNRAVRHLQSSIIPTTKKYIKKMLGKSIITQHTDRLTEDSINNNWMKKIDDDFIRAKSEADLVCILLHIGGQFNIIPGDFHEYMFRHFKDMGANIIIGHHPHTLQKIVMDKGCLCAYSLGGCLLSPGADYLVKESLPEYSIALHVNLEESGKVMNYEIEFLKCVEDSNHYVHVVKAESESENIDVLKKRVFCIK